MLNLATCDPDISAGRPVAIEKYLCVCRCLEISGVTEDHFACNRTDNPRNNDLIAVFTVSHQTIDTVISSKRDVVPWFPRLPGDELLEAILSKVLR